MPVALRSDMGTSPVALVTGAAGFTGRYVCRSLQAAGYSVQAWGHHQQDGVRAVDLNDRGQIEQALADVRPDVVLHLAGIAFVAHGDVDSIYRTNVVGTRNLLEGLVALPVAPSRVLLASSANVYGNAAGVVGEDSPVSPQNDYAVSKLAMEYMAQLWAQRLPITIVRPFNYTGAGQSENFLLPKIVSHFALGARTIELGNIDVSRDFNDVRNVADIYTRLLAPGVASGTFNVCSGREHSLAEVIELMQEIAGYTIKVEVNSAFVRANEVKRLRGDPSKLLSALGRLPDFELSKTLNWMFAQYTA